MNEIVLFGTNGIRGLVNQDLTPERVVKLSVAIGTYFKQGKLLIGSDSRTSSTIFSRAVTAGLASTGCHVFDVGYTPTPAIQYAVKHFHLDGAVIITASHNPPEYNGIKVVSQDGIEIARDEEHKIETIFFKDAVHRARWDHIGNVSHFPGVIDAYKTAILTHIDTATINKHHFKVVVDPVNSVGSLVTPSLLKEVGCHVVTINAQLDGHFSRTPEPKPETLTELAKTVTALNADLGVAHDGDADRCMFVDEEGTVVWGDQTGALLIGYLLERDGAGTVVTPISSSRLLEDIVTQQGGQLVWTQVGSTIVTNTMMKVGAEIGFEDNGGLFYRRHQPVRDGPLAALMMLEILAQRGKSLSQLIGELPKYHLIKDSIDCPNAQKQIVLKRLLKETDGLTRQTIDGVKLFFDDGSVLIRPSGTEAIYRVYAEAKTAERANELAEWSISLVRKILTLVDVGK